MFLFESLCSCPYCFPILSLESAQAPKFDVPLKPVTVNEGEKLSLKCHVVGSPPLKVQWMKDRRELKSNRETQITLADGSVCLEVNAVSKTDAGDYLCKASNPAGSTFCKSRVTVKGTLVYPTKCGLFVLGSSFLAVMFFWMTHDTFVIISLIS